MSDGTIWDIPAEVIAKDRARYYAGRDSSVANYDKAYKKELAFTLSDAREILEWARGDMNWSEVSEHATEVRTKPSVSCYDTDWPNAYMEVIE